METRKPIIPRVFPPHFPRKNSGRNRCTESLQANVERLKYLGSTFGDFFSCRTIIFLVLPHGLRRYVGELRHFLFVESNQPIFWCLQSECLEVRINSVSTYSMYMYVRYIDDGKFVGHVHASFCVVEVGSAQLVKWLNTNERHLQIKSALTLGESICCTFLLGQNSFSFQLP